METRDKNIISRILCARLKRFQAAPEPVRNYLMTTACLTFECFKRSPELTQWFDDWLKAVQTELLDFMESKLCNSDVEKTSPISDEDETKENEDSKKNSAILKQAMQEFGLELMRSLVDHYPLDQLSDEDRNLLTTIRDLM